MKAFQPSIEPSIGASARPATMEAAMTMPPVICPSMARYAPQPSMPTCVSIRTARLTEALMMLRSCARTCAISDAAVSRPQIVTASGIMAMALMIWLLRDMESRCMFALAWARFASAKGLAVMRWLTSATTSSSSAVTTTIMPRCGWIMKITRMKRGAKGTSRKEINVPETRKPRNCCRSPSVWYSRPEPLREAAAAALSTGAPSRAATSTAVRISMKRRTASNMACSTTAPTITRVSMISVSVDRLVNTRSEIWNR